MTVCHSDSVCRLWMNFESRSCGCGSLIESRIRRPRQRPSGRFWVMHHPPSLHLFLCPNRHCLTGRVWWCSINLLKNYWSGQWCKHKTIMDLITVIWIRFLACTKSYDSATVNLKSWTLFSCVIVIILYYCIVIISCIIFFYYSLVLVSPKIKKKKILWNGFSFWLMLNLFNFAFVFNCFTPKCHIIEVRWFANTVVM